MDSVAIRTPLDNQGAARIGKRLAMGLTVDQACVLEDPPLTVEEYTQSIDAKPELALTVKRIEAWYIEKLLNDVERGDQMQGSKWILERVHRGQFGDKAGIVNNNLTINGFSPEVVEQIRKAAKMKAVIDVKPE